MCVSMCVYECVCVCVCERERERGCVCVCVLRMGGGRGGDCRTHTPLGRTRVARTVLFASSSQSPRPTLAGSEACTLNQTNTIQSLSQPHSIVCDFNTYLFGS